MPAAKIGLFAGQYAGVPPPGSQDPRASRRSSSPSPTNQASPGGRSNSGSTIGGLVSLAPTAGGAGVDTLPTELPEAKSDLRDLLVYPPSSQGEAAMASLATLEEVTLEREAALVQLQMASEHLSDVVRRGASDSHLASLGNVQCDPFDMVSAKTARRAHRRINKAQQEVDRCYQRFLAADKRMKNSQSQLDTSYDSYYMGLLHQEALEVAAQRREEAAILAQTRKLEEERAEEERTIRTYQTMAVADFLVKAIKDPSIMHQNTRAVWCVQMFEKMQAHFKGRRVRRRMMACRRFQGKLNVNRRIDSFWRWRMAVQSELFYRRRLLRKTFAPLLANANTLAMRRTQFCLHFDRCRTQSTLYRCVEVWRRYTKYLKVPVNPITGRRDVFFETPMASWDNFVREDEKRVNLRRSGTVVAERASDPYLLKAHFMTRWWKFVLRRRWKKQQLVDAGTYNDKKVMRRHFFAWADLVTFEAQREGANFAAKQYYLARWRSAVLRAKRERRASAAMQPLKKLSLLTQWRKATVDLRRNQASAMLTLQGSKCMALYYLTALADNRVEFLAVSGWRRWRILVQRRKAWRAYVAGRWQKRVPYLKGVCFRHWKMAVKHHQRSTSPDSTAGGGAATEAMAKQRSLRAGLSLTAQGFDRGLGRMMGHPPSPSHGSAQTSMTLLSPESQVELFEEYRQIRHRSLINNIMKEVNFLTGSINERSLEVAELLEGVFDAASPLSSGAGSPMNPSRAGSMLGSPFGSSAHIKHGASVGMSVLPPQSPKKGGGGVAASLGFATSQASGSFDIGGFLELENLYAKDVPLRSDPELEAEKEGVEMQYQDWLRIHDGIVCFDKALLYAIVQLLIINRRMEKRQKQQQQHQMMMSPKHQVVGSGPQSQATSPGGLSESQGSSLAPTTPLEIRRMRNSWTVMCVGQPMYNPQRLELVVGSVEHFVREEGSYNTLLRVKREKRHGRQLRRLEARLAANRLFNECAFFTCSPAEERHPGFSPFQFMIEEYDHIMNERMKTKEKQEKKDKGWKAGKGSGSGVYSSRGTKYTISLPELPLARRLPFLLRLHLQEIVESEEHQRNIEVRKMMRLRVARAVRLSKLAMQHFAFQSRSGWFSEFTTDEGERRCNLVRKAVIREARTLRIDVLARRYHNLIPASCLVVDQDFVLSNQYDLLNLLGFNPQFLRGAIQFEMRKQRKIRTVMNEHAKELSELGLVEDREIRRCNSGLSPQFIPLSKKAERDDFVGSLQPRHNTMPNPVLPNVWDEIGTGPLDAEEVESVLEGESLRTDEGGSGEEGEEGEEDSAARHAREEEIRELMEGEDMGLIRQVQSMYSMLGTPPGTPLLPGEMEGGIGGGDVRSLGSDASGVLQSISSSVKSGTRWPSGVIGVPPAPGPPGTASSVRSSRSAHSPRSAGSEGRGGSRGSSRSASDYGGLASVGGGTEGEEGPTPFGSFEQPQGKPATAGTGSSLSSTKLGPMTPKSAGGIGRRGTMGTGGRSGSTSPFDATLGAGEEGWRETPRSVGSGGGATPSSRNLKGSLLDRGSAYRQQRRSRSALGGSSRPATRGRRERLGRSAGGGSLFGTEPDLDLEEESEEDLDLDFGRQDDDEEMVVTKGKRKSAGPDVTKGGQVHVAALDHPTLGLRVQLETKEELMAKRLRQQKAKAEAARKRQGKKEDQPRVLRAVARLWDDSAFKGSFVPSVERLLEISARYGTLLSLEMNEGLDKLKSQVEALVEQRGGAPEVEAVASVQSLAEKMRGLIDSKAQDAEKDKKEQEAVAKEGKMKQQHQGERGALYTAQPTKFPYQPPERRLPVSAPPNTEPSPSRKPLYVGRPPVREGPPSAPPVLIDGEPVRRQLLKVPYNFAGAVSDASETQDKMLSTAMLVNDLFGERLSRTAPSAEVPSKDARRYLKKAHTDHVPLKDRDRPWREPPSRPSTSHDTASPIKPRHREGAMTAKERLQQRKLLDLARQAETREARKRVHLANAKREAKEHERKQAEEVERAKVEEFDVWVAEQVDALALKSSYQAAYDTLLSEYKLLHWQHKQAAARRDETMDPAGKALERGKIDILYTKLKKIEAALQYHPLVDPTNALDGAIERRSFTPSTQGRPSLLQLRKLNASASSAARQRTPLGGGTPRSPATPGPVTRGAGSKARESTGTGGRSTKGGGTGVSLPPLSDVEMSRLVSYIVQTS